MRPEFPIPTGSTERDPFELPDFEPMYELDEADYQAVIHRLAQLLADTVEVLRDDGQIDRAMAVASQANDVLLSYDDDVAEIVRTAGQTKEIEGGLGQAREKGLW